MQNPAHRFGWPGLALLLTLSTSGLVACAAAPWSLAPAAPPSQMDTVRFLATALEADGPARETLWKSVATAGKSDDSDLRIALLQSIPGHSGYEPVTARERLQALASRAGTPERIATVARLRLAQAQSDAAMSAELAQLRQRLARVVEIEKRQNNAASAPSPPASKDFAKESFK